MEQKEKLIKIIETAFESQENDKCRECDVYDCAKCVSEYIVDNLLANGVVVSPCKVGDTVYDIYEAFHNGEGDVRALKVTDIHIHLDKRDKAWIIIGGYYFALDDFGKTVFLTREEAEKALAKRKVGE